MPIWYGLLVVVALWTLARPYVGLRHDGALYLAQALRHLWPETMAGDVFFAYGSQDSFTVFGRLLALLYAHWDIATVQVAILLSCQIGLLVALFALLKPLASDPQRWLALAAVAVMSHAYGGFGMFAFAERFVTARSLAEPLAMGALALLSVRHGAGALVLLLLAAVVHPLMAAPAIVVAWVLCWQRDRRWGWAALALPIPLLLGLAEVPPFTALLQRYDPEWWQPVVRTNAVALLREWEVPDWQLFVFDVATLALALRWLPVQLSSLCRAVLLVTGALMLASFVGADLLRNVLVTQLQLWRVTWLLHVLALALLPALLARAWALGARGHVLALALAAAAVAVNGRWDAGWAFVVWGGFAWWLATAQPPVSDRMLRLLFGSSVAALLAVGAGVLDGNIALLAGAQPSLDVPTWLLLVATLPLLSLPVAAGLLWGWQRGRATAAACCMVALAAAVAGSVLIDRRSPWTRAIETSLHAEHPFSARIPQRAQVYWHDSATPTWVMLKRASYISLQQSVGVLFNRGTAMEMQRRQRIFGALDLQRQVCSMTDALKMVPDAEGPCSPTLPVIERICRADRGPDFLVFEERLARGIVDEWTFQPPGMAARTFYLYDCLRLR